MATPEQIAARQETLAKDRETAARNRQAKAEAEAAKPAVSATPTPAVAAEDIPVMPRLGMEGVAEIEPEPVAIADEPTDPFERFLAAQDEETRLLLSDIELRVIFEEETRKARAAQKEQAKQAAKARAARHAKADAGLITEADVAAAALAERNARKVRYTPELPQLSNGEPIDVGLRINGAILFDRQERTVTVGEYESQREILYRSMTAELDFEGKGRLSQLRRSSTRALNTNLSGVPV
jgi:hypothetical protein